MAAFYFINMDYQLICMTSILKLIQISKGLLY
jgi:hypothetical protein